MFSFVLFFLSFLGKIKIKLSCSAVVCEAVMGGMGDFLYRSISVWLWIYKLADFNSPFIL